MSNCHSSERGRLFVATGLHEVEAEPEGTEVLSLRRVPFDEAVRMVTAGEIRDAFSIMGILLLDRLLREGKQFT